MHRFFTDIITFAVHDCLQHSEVLFAICYCPSICHLSVTLVHPTQAVEIFGDISTAFGTLATHWYPQKILRRLSQGNPSIGRVKHKRGSQT